MTSTGTPTQYGNTTSCDAKEHIAMSGVSIQAWKGGNMPEIEDKLYNYVFTKSSFTVLAFTILTFAITWGVASALSSTIGTTALATGLSPLASATIGAGLYAGVNVLGGAGLTDAQGGWFGSTGDGVLKVNTTNMDQHQKRLLQGVENKQIKSRIGTGLTGQTKLYSGNCPESNTVAQCNANGLDPGTMHRPDEYTQTNIPLLLAEQKKTCEENIPLSDKQKAEVDPVFKETLRKFIQQCASPQEGIWQTGW